MMNTVAPEINDNPSDINRKSGKVKWYSDRKGYGFLDIDGEEVFIHRSALLTFGVIRLQNEDIVLVSVRETDRGLVADQLFAIERPPMPPELFADEPEEGEEFAEVKFFNEEKGYGFIVVDNYDDDIFIHSRTLEQNGLAILESGQRLLVRVEEGERGKEVTTIRFFTGDIASEEQPSL